MNRMELLMRRKNVLAFIKADPIVLNITRRTPPTKSGAGGWIAGTPEPLPPQQARIVLNKRRFNKGIVNIEAGEIPHTDYLLIGVHTLDAETEDEFVWLGIHYHITGIYTARQESFLASIDLLGPENRHA